MLAGKKRGRPRSNPLPILTAAHLMSNSNNNNNGSDGGSMISGDGTGRWFVLQMFVVYIFVICIGVYVFVIGVVLSVAFFTHLRTYQPFMHFHPFHIFTGNKRLRGAELAETIALAAAHLTNGTQNSTTTYNTNNNNNSSSSSGGGGGATPANVPINASAEVAAGRTKIGRSSFWNEERVSLL